MNTNTATRKRVGLALGGGAVRGMAHIGVLRVLEEAGIPVDYIAGTSVGSLIGAIYAAGTGAAQLEALASRFGWRHMVGPAWPRYGFFTLRPLERRLIKILGDLRIEALKIPYAAVATDMRTAQIVVLREGRLAPAVRASCSVPGIFTPVELEGRLLGDGGVLENLPARVAAHWGPSTSSRSTWSVADRVGRPAPSAWG